MNNRTNRLTTTSKAISLALVLSLHGALPAHGEDAKLHRERIEWCDIWIADAEKSELPRVLLIGDSIARGYFAGVEDALNGTAYCARLTTSRSVCDPVFFDELSLVLKQYPFTVIHFNNGLHGWGYTEAEYRDGFGKLVTALREHAPGATLICALTTPVQETGGMKAHAHRVAERNAIAKAICAASDIALTDLHGLSVESPEHFSGDGVHFNPEGRAAQARLVAKAVGDALDPP